MKLYEHAGAQEYWIVDDSARGVTVWHFAANTATSRLYCDADVIETPLAPGLQVKVADLWQ